MFFASHNSYLASRESYLVQRRTEKSEDNIVSSIEYIVYSGEEDRRAHRALVIQFTG